MLVVLDTLAPAERLAFVLHDMFAVPFDEIGPIVGRSPETARQLASRARRRVQGASPPSEADVARPRAVVEAFLAASRGGDFARLLSLLDPDIVLRADEAAVATGAQPEVSGAQAVAEVFSGRAQAAQPALIDGGAGLAWAPRGHARVVFAMTVSDGRVTAIEMVADAASIEAMELVLLDG
jgi:RNA polymerase sigma-70 factor (ECF subfamily)